MSAQQIDEGTIPHLHRFDPVSGWCSGCGYRDDGGLVDSRSGRPLRAAPGVAHGLTIAQIEALLEQHGPPLTKTTKGPRA